MRMTPPVFVFATCQPASSPWLKADVLAEHPSWRLAYSRPGLITFKADGDDARVSSPYARVWGQSIDRAAGVEELASLIGEPSDPLRLHVFDREEEGRAAQVEAEIRAAMPGRILPDVMAWPGERVIDVVVDAPGEPWLVGWHEHTEHRSPWPGGPRRVALPPDAPSRAYAKIEEAIEWSGMDIAAGQVAVEIGAAPGGSVLALLERGLEVTAIDPAAMDPRVLEYRGTRGNRCRHLQQTAGTVQRDALPARVDWLLSDANLAPPIALRTVERLAGMLRPRGVVLTLKLNDEHMRAQLADFVARVGRLGLGPARAAQLPSHRHEVVAVACDTNRKQ